MLKLKRDFRNMDELVDLWVLLGDRTQPKPAAPKGRRNSTQTTTKKALTAGEELARTEIAIANRIKGEEEEKLLAPAQVDVEDGVDEDAIDVDESTLCPFCDQSMPTQPTQILVGMLEAARLKSVPECRPGNRFGLRLIVPVAAPVCVRHEFEKNLLPMAIAQGWPTELDLVDLEQRIKQKKPIFDALVNNRDWEAGKGPRYDNILWLDAVLATQSGRGGLAGNILTFNKVQPGYYGELGTRRIDQTFHRMLEFSEDCTLPLTVLQFVQLVLIPEAGVQLIMDDLGAAASRDDAMQVMWASGSYGASMFPDDEYSDD